MSFSGDFSLFPELWSRYLFILWNYCPKIHPNLWNYGYHFFGQNGTSLSHNRLSSPTPPPPETLHLHYIYTIFTLHLPFTITFTLHLRLHYIYIYIHICYIWYLNHLFIILPYQVSCPQLFFINGDPIYTAS